MGRSFKKCSALCAFIEVLGYYFLYYLFKHYDVHLLFDFILTHASHLDTCGVRVVSQLEQKAVQ